MEEAGYGSDEADTKYVMDSFEKLREANIPRAGQSRNAGKVAVEAYLTLEAAMEEEEKRRDAVDTKLRESNDPGQWSNLSAQIASLDSSVAQKRRTLATMQTRLGVDGAEELRRLKGSEYLKLVANARTLKIRTRTKLVDRKFEMSRMERPSHESKAGTWQQSELR